MEKLDRETINEHIRNSLTPIQNLISIIETDEAVNKTNFNKKLFSELLQQSRISIHRLCGLGINAKEAEIVWQKLKEKYK